MMDMEGWVRVTKRYKTDDGLTVWPGDVFLKLNGDVVEDGAEIKVAGRYTWIPPEVFEPAGEQRSGDRGW